MRLAFFLLGLISLFSTSVLTHASDETLTTYHPVSGNVVIPIVWLEDNQTYYFNAYLDYDADAKIWTLRDYAHSSPTLSPKQASSLSITEYKPISQTVHIPIVCDQTTQEHCFENIVLSRLAPFTAEHFRLVLTTGNTSTHGLCEPVLNGRWHVQGLLTHTETEISSDGASQQQQTQESTVSVDEVIEIKNSGNRIYFTLNQHPFSGTCSRTTVPQQMTVDMDAWETVRQQKNGGRSEEISVYSDANLILESPNSMRQVGYEKVTIKTLEQTKTSSLGGKLIFTKKQ